MGMQKEKNVSNYSEAKWSNNVTMNDKIALEDIKNIIEETRPNGTYKAQKMLSDTDWKSISNALPPKQNAFKHGSMPQKAYTVQKYKKRLFLPTQPMQQTVSAPSSSEEQTQRIAPPQPVPKPTVKKSQQMPKFVPVPNNVRCVVADNNRISVANYPKVR